MYYFKESSSNLEALDMDSWLFKYDQLIYALEFDSRRLNGDKDNPAKLPL